MTTPGIPQKAKSYKNKVLFVICLGSALVPFMATSINLSLPYIAKDYDINSITQSWIVTSFLISSTIFQIPFGRLADIIGRKRVYMYGLLIVALSSFACAVPLGAGFLIGLRVVQGIGCAMIFGTGIAILAAVFGSEGRGQAMGINVAVVYLSAALGPSLGGFIMYYFDWHSIFVITGIMAFIAFIGVRTVIKIQLPTAKGEPFDMAGSVMYGLALIMIIYGFTILPSLTGFLLITAGLALFVFFVYYEKDKTHPVLKVNMFLTNRLFTFSSAAALINYAATFPISFFMSLYLQEIRGIGIQHAGLILIIQPAVQAILSPLAGRLSDKISSRYLASGGMALITVALLCMGLFVTPLSSMAFIISLLVMFGVGFAAFSSPNMNAIMGSVRPHEYSTASATTGTVRLTGQTLSMGITTMIFSLFLAKEKISSAVAVEFMQAMHTAFLIFAGICLLGVYMSMARGKK